MKREGREGVLVLESYPVCCVVLLILCISVAAAHKLLNCESPHAVLTHRPHPSALVLSVSANKYTHNRTCADKSCIHRAHQFTLAPSLSVQPEQITLHGFPL